MMAGYYRRQDETSKARVDDGWLCTGDIDRMDEEGYMYIVDRKKNVIFGKWI
ncbi:MAG: AMP-binding protein [Saprospiraceae bacterium]|nr:AMP-binding protein [Saprospiraceae bacterium]